jgi:crossover junction endodeoxyribonuclease RuvC
VKVIGLDMSITCSGITIIDGDIMRVSTVPTKPEKARHDIERYAGIVETVLQRIGDVSDTLIFIEQYAFSASGQVTRIAELGGILRYSLFYRVGLPFNRLFEVSPPTLKKFILGKGSGKKEQIIKEVYKRYGYDAKFSDEADAICLAKIGELLVNDIEGATKWQKESVLAVLKTNHMTMEDFRNVLVCASSTPGGKVCGTAPKRAADATETAPAPCRPPRTPKTGTAPCFDGRGDTGEVATDSSSFFSRRILKTGSSS